jgi:hypothetical protein
MKFLKIVAMFAGLTAILSAAEFKLEFVKSIGDERDSHAFFKLSGAALSRNKDIYVSDLSGHFVAKYKWDGTFVKRIGQQGAGPGDFGNVNFLTIEGKTLYVYDNSNLRIVEMDMDLNILKYIKVDSRFFRYAYPLKEGRFLGDYMSAKKKGENSGRIGIVNQDGELLNCFFDQQPIEKVPLKDQMKLIRLSAYSIFGMDLSPDKESILVHFYYSPNPIVLFIYDLNGKLMQTIKYEVDKKFQFPEHFLEYKPSYPTPYHFLMVSSAFFYNSNFIVFYEENSQLNEKELESKSFCLLFDKEGKIVQRIPLEKPIGFFFLSPDGYLLGSAIEDEITKLFVYRITLVE